MGFPDARCRHRCPMALLPAASASRSAGRGAARQGNVQQGAVCEQPLLGKEWWREGGLLAPRGGVSLPRSAFPVGPVSQLRACRDGRAGRCFFESPRRGLCAAVTRWAGWRWAPRQQLRCHQLPGLRAAAAAKALPPGCVLGRGDGWLRLLGEVTGRNSRLGGVGSLSGGGLVAGEGLL